MKPALVVSVDPQDRERWKAHAARRGMSLSAWVRHILNNEIAGRDGVSDGSLPPSPVAGPGCGGPGPALQSDPTTTPPPFDEDAGIPGSRARSGESGTSPRASSELADPSRPGENGRRRGGRIPAGGSASYSAPGTGETSPGPHDGAEAAPRPSAARSSGVTPVHTADDRSDAAAGTGATTSPGAPPTGDPATAGAPAPSIFREAMDDLKDVIVDRVERAVQRGRCTHPRETLERRPWGTTCGVCGLLV